MREMKDSGIEWIGKIPADWIIEKVKNATSYIGSGATPTSGKSEFYDDGTVNWIQSGDLYGKDEINDVSANVTDYAVKLFSALHIYKAPFIVIAMYGGSVGNIAISNIDACVNQACCCIQEDSQNYLKFMYYWLFSCKSDFLRVTDGGGQPNISQTKIKNQYYLQPSIPEQHSISSYLDAKCAEIDALTADIQSQIDTLEQYKRSVITEAVTKGLDKDVEMKESGIPFIGAIPAHWKSDKLKYHLQRNEPRNPGEQEVLSLYRDYGIVPKDSRDDNFNVTSEDTTNYKYVRVGDFVINKMKAWQGSVAVSDYEGIVSPAYYVYKFTDDNIYRRYFHYLLRACYKDEFMRLSGGIRVGQWDLSATALENTYILLPPYEEQVRIADYLDDKKKDIDDAIASKHDQLATLDAYKKSTIYEYVTGKKEVPAV